MAKRGLYAKGIAKREEILDTALQVIAGQGYSSATVKELAAAVGLSQTGLLHYFGSKENLFAEVLRRRDQSDAQNFEPQGDPIHVLSDFGASMGDIVRRNAQVPGLVQLSTSVTAEAVQPDHAAHDFVKERYQRITEIFARAVEDLKQEGIAGAVVDADKVGVLMMAMVEGLQSQWLYDPQLDMPAHIRYFWELVDHARAASVLAPVAGSGASGGMEEQPMLHAT